MCESCGSFLSKGINRREFIGKTAKASGAISLAVAGGTSALATNNLMDGNLPNTAFGKLEPLKKAPAHVKVVFLYPPADVVNKGQNEDRWAQYNWFTWPGSQFEPENQEKIFTSKISLIARKLGVQVDFASKPVYQKAKVEEFIRQSKSEKPDAVLVVNFWNTFARWSFEIATQSAPTAIVYQPVGSNHQLPLPELMNAKGFYYIHSIENWDEIERGLYAVRTKKILAQSRLLRITDQAEPMVQNREELLGVDIVSINADEFNNLFDSIQSDGKIMKEAMAIKKNASLVMDVEDLYFTEGIRAHHAVAKIMEQYGADAITIKCLMLKHRKPCISFSINNGRLVPCGCENDLNATLTQMLGQQLFDRGGFQHNPEFDLSNNHYFGAHCTCPTKLYGQQGPSKGYLVRPFFHQLPKTAALDIQWTTDEPVMLTKYYSGENKLSCWTGKVVVSPKSPPTGGCATRVLVEIDKVSNVCDAYLGPHPILFCGNRGDARKLKAFAQMYNLSFGGNI